jgi:hypothetical protein
VKHADASGRFIHYQEDTITAKFRKYRDEAGLSPPITFHSLRHPFATNLAASGVSFKTVQGLLGQSDPDSTKVYRDPFEEEIKKAAEIVQLPKRDPPSFQITQNCPFSVGAGGFCRRHPSTVYLRGESPRPWRRRRHALAGLRLAQVFQISSNAPRFDLMLANNCIMS